MLVGIFLVRSISFIKADAVSCIAISLVLLADLIDLEDDAKHESKYKHRAKGH